VIVRIDTGTYNASYHRLQIVGSDRAAASSTSAVICACFRARQAQRRSAADRSVHRPDLALHYTAATMGSQMPEHADDPVAGGLCGRPLGRKGRLAGS
jgi:2,5-furandicarboxylate decarboxylase 1